MVENYPSHYLVIWWTIWKERNASCLEDITQFYTEAKKQLVPFWCNEELVGDAESLIL